jgi:AcrR family transcriptional regulator
MAAARTETRLRPRKTPRQTRAVETRARILDAAREVFAAHGYAAGTTNRIADAAGLSVGSLYQYFPNKDAILVELVHVHVEDGTRAVLAAAAQATPDGTATGAARLEPLVHDVVAAMVGVHAGDRALHRVLFEESPRPPSLLAELHRTEERVVDTVTGMLDDAFPDGAAPDGAGHELPARIVVATIESLVHRLVATDRPLGEARVTDEITRLVAAYLATLEAR